MTGYYDNPRPVVLELLDRRPLRLIEIGCGTGATLRLLREHGRCAWAAGVEANEAAAAAAGAHADRLFVGDLEKLELDIPPASLDAVLCLDVLEHMVDPWRAVARLAALLKPDGAFIASIPNLRYYKVSLPMVLRGRWRYADSGILDRTHLRFFTRETVVDLLGQAGLAIDSSLDVGLAGKRNRQIWNALTLGLLRDLFVYQYIVRARLKRGS